MTTEQRIERINKLFAQIDRDEKKAAEIFTGLNAMSNRQVDRNKMMADQKKLYRRIAKANQEISKHSSLLGEQSPLARQREECRHQSAFFV